MTAVLLQVGQCGNQIGQEWWKIITNGSTPNSKATRSFRDTNIILGHGGRGNNWAYGYHGQHSESENSLLKQTMESLRKEVERRDSYSGTVLLHSLSGGTGSGLGARLCETIREEFPLGHILSVTVAPHHMGESPLQHFNSLLCLSWLQRYADGVLLFHNDDVLRRMVAMSGRKTADAMSGHSSQISLSAMNSHIASCLAGLMYPVQTLTTGSGLSIGMEPWELLRSVCPMPSMKFLHVTQRSTRGTAFWDSLTSSIVHTLQRQSPSGKPHYSTAVLAVARGNHDNSFFSSVNSVLMKLKQGYRCVPWNPTPIDYWTDPYNIVDPGSHSQSLTLCANHSSVMDYLNRVLERARAMYEAHAYLHWYWKYHCEEEDFRQAFETLGTVLEDYSSAGD
nr:PREDICTED: tubulin delta chain-like [Latimeria chalumnae]|eukprot:XP_005990788.1 PREDICTED: tubulin delta chain-like [Latimeria chalumnae]